MQIAQATEQVARRRQELESSIEALRAFERDYRARLRGFVEGQFRALEDAAPGYPLSPRELGQSIDELRAFERDYRARLRGFVEGQLKALEDAAPSGPVPPPQPPSSGGKSRPMPGADELPNLPGSRRERLRDLTSERNDR
jgi:hypothetical protein